jgi:Lectin C-type domain
MTQRVLLLLGLLGGCSFDGSAGVDPDAMPIDSAIDGMPDTPVRQCASTYVQVAGAPVASRYRMLPASGSVAQQTAMCAGDGAHLVVIDDVVELTALQIYAPKRNGFFWVGLTDEAVEGEWRTSKGEVASYLPWKKGQPDGGTTANCALLADNELVDFGCSGGYPSVCECD